VPRRLVPYLLLVLLALIFFGELLLHPTRVLYSDHSDLLEEVLPAKCFLARSWQATGELPLWNPYSYAGMPFIHDVKVGAFYPLHIPLWWLPEAHQGAAVSWLVVLHIIVAGWGTYTYGRARGLGLAGALIAAIGFMFSGKMMLHLLGGGHYFLVPLAWMPWVLLALEPAVRRGSLPLATIAGALFALIVLGAHPQMTFYSGVFVALWTAGPALESAGYFGAAGPRARRRTWAALGRWLGCGAWAAVVAVALSAVELWPALEATREATRGMGVTADDGVANSIWLMLRLVGPSLTGGHWEGRGGLGVLWIATAALAPVLRRGVVRYQAGIALVLVVFALGGGALLQKVPGFNLFQLHSRMLLPASFAVAVLAGTTVDALLTQPAIRRRSRVVFIGAVLIAGLLAAGGAALDYASPGVLKPSPAALGWWILVLAGAVVLAGMLGRTERWTALVWGTILLAELWLISLPLVAVRSQEEVYVPSACVGDVAGGGRVLDRGLTDSPASTPLTPSLASVEGIEALRGYNSLDVRRYKEYLQFITDSDRPLRPREGPFGFPILQTFPIRNKDLLDLLGTKYLLQPADMPIDTDGSGWQRGDTDPKPSAYLVIAGGRQTLAPYTVYRNEDVFPRAFVVPHAQSLPRDGVLAALRSADLRQTVFLEDWNGKPGEARSDGFRAGDVAESGPNRVVVKVKQGPGGFLVLADIWYPGWRCTVDGREAPLYRADYLFRAVELSEGEHTVVFTFDPLSYRYGRAISLATLLALPLLLLLSRLRIRRIPHHFVQL
jgi:hypothetical protein